MVTGLVQRKGKGSIGKSERQKEHIDTSASESKSKSIQISNGPSEKFHSTSNPSPTSPINILKPHPHTLSNATSDFDRNQGHSSSSSSTESDVNTNQTMSNTQQTTLLMDEPGKKKWKNWWIRTLWTFVMISGFLGIILSGHIWVVLLVVVIQTLVYWEVISIAHVPSKAKKMPWFRTMSWYFLLSTNYFLVTCFFGGFP
jgi:hypothetical protein